VTLELKIDPEFKELIPPLSNEEYIGLENNILNYGYDKKYPISVWDNTIIDGHHRYKICKEHGIAFSIEELKFDSRPSALIWMIDNQKNKRNANKMTLTYLIGRQYRESKNPHGGNRNSSGQNDHLKTSDRIAGNSNTNEKTVRRAADFSENLEKICENAGIKRQEILLGNIDATMKDVNDLAEYAEPEFHKRAIDKLLNKEEKDLKRAISQVDKEYRDERARQATEEENKRKEEELKKAADEEQLEAEKKRIEEEQRLIEEEKNRIICKNGTWYKLGEHLLYCGSNEDDSFKIELKKHPISFVFADPPYNANVAEWDNNFTWTQDWLVDIAPVVAVTPGTISIHDFMNSTKMPYTWAVACWVDNGMAFGKLGSANWIFTALFSRKTIHCNSQDFLRVSINNSKNDETDHKGRKPDQLIDWFFSKFSKKHDYVADPFLGSGTSLLVADTLQRICIGAEIIPEKCNEIIKRWESKTDKKVVIFDN
jgi:ParB-like chromosome segregation protein Spo0J